MREQAGNVVAQDEQVGALAGDADFGLPWPKI